MNTGRVHCLCAWSETPRLLPCASENPTTRQRQFRAMGPNAKAGWATLPPDDHTVSSWVEPKCISTLDRFSCKVWWLDHALSPFPPLGPQRVDLPGRMGPGVWKRVWQHDLLRVAGRRRVHAGARRRQLRRGSLVGAPGCRPTRVPAARVRLLRTADRRPGGG